MRLVAALLLLGACHKSTPAPPEYRRTFGLFVRQHESELRSCWAQEYAKRPTELKWETPTFRFTIAGDGRVRDVSVTGGDPIVAACWQKTLAAWVFPPPGGDYPVTYRWALRGAQ